MGKKKRSLHDEGRSHAKGDQTSFVVGIGSSAGGLEALGAFLANMPPDSGHSFVIVTHQHPDHTSLLPELLARDTVMPVVAATEGVLVEANHVYVAPPGVNLSISRRRLALVDPGEQPPPPHPIDYFFRSLAHDQRDHAVGIVLSGSGTDGTMGIRELKGSLGIVMAQAPETAQYPGMPQSAIASGQVDFVRPAEELPAQLLAYAGKVRRSSALEPQSPEVDTVGALQKIHNMLRRRTGHDFSSYKTSTVARRLGRRMGIHQITDAEDYVSYLAEHPEEVDVLFKELLIGVTSFFRDDEAFEALAATLREYLSGKPDDYVFRVWVPGCSTGEEAYSLAMLISESMDLAGAHCSVQIFATDIDSEAIDTSRAGVYPDGSALDLGKARLDKFFVHEEGSYRIRPRYREMVVFATHNIAHDPPFTKIDLLSCRNLLIYFDKKLQERLLPLFHYALKPGGLLFLGSSESIGSSGNLFSTIDPKAKLFRRLETSTGYAPLRLPTGLFVPPLDRGLPLVPATQASSRENLATTADGVLAQYLVPPTVFVQERGEIVHIHGRTGLYLEPPPGPQTAPNIFRMARKGLQAPISAAIRQAASSQGPALFPRIPIHSNEKELHVTLRVQRVDDPGAFHGLFLVSFEHVLAEAAGTAGEEGAAEHSPASRIAELERELQYSRESLQGMIEELETSNEELKSTNEELQSTNEELQSTSEEMETAKEEMQSLNEELQTLNAELQSKVEELTLVNDDMKNLLNSTDIATIFVDQDLNIKRYTERATSVIRLIPSDVGRSIGDLVSELDYDDLVEDSKSVLDTLVPREVELRGKGDTRFLMSIKPYRTTENLIDGLVMTFVNITRLRALEVNQERLLQALARSPTIVYGQDAEFRIQWTCGGLVFGRPADKVIGKKEGDLISAAGADAILDIKRRALSEGVAIHEEVKLAIAGKPATYDMYVEPVLDDSGVVGLTSVCTDISSRK